MSDEKNKVDTTTEIKNSEMKKAEIKKADANVKTMEDFTSPEILYDELIASVKKYHPSTDISMIEKAYKIAYEAHEGQKRKSGEPYIIHPLCVAIILADLELVLLLCHTDQYRNFHRTFLSAETAKYPGRIYPGFLPEQRCDPWNCNYPESLRKRRNGTAYDHRQCAAL